MQLIFVKKYYKDQLADNWEIVNSNFSKIDTLVEKYPKPDGILMDLGFLLGN